MSPRKQTIKILNENGYELKRKGANHDIYFSPISRRTIPVKRHDFDESDMRYILQEAGMRI